MCASRSSGVVASPAHFKDSSAHARYSAAVIIFYFHIAAHRGTESIALARSVSSGLFVTVETGFTNRACAISPAVSRYLRRSAAPHRWWSLTADRRLARAIIPTGHIKYFCHHACAFCDHDVIIGVIIGSAARKNQRSATTIAIATMAGRRLFGALAWRCSPRSVEPRRG